MRPDQFGQLNSGWWVSEWTHAKQRAFPELAKWRKKRAYLARGTGHLLVWRVGSDAWYAAAIDLDNMTYLLARTGQLWHCYRLLNTHMKLDGTGWNPLVCLPEHGQEKGEVSLWLPR